MNTEPLKRFISRVKQAVDANNTELRMPVAEAHILAATLAEMMIDIVNRPTTSQAVQPATMSLDGGSFSKSGKS